MGKIVGNGDIGDDLYGEMVKLFGDEGLQDVLDCVCSLLENMSEPVGEILFKEGGIDFESLSDILRLYGLMSYASGYVHGKSEGALSRSKGDLVGDICPVGRLSGSC